jgi:ribosome biogenesis GTPase
MDDPTNDKPHGVVTSVSSRSVQVHLQSRGNVRCTLRGNLWDEDSKESRPVAVGDRVEVTLEGEVGVIESVAPRANRLARPQTRDKQQRVQVIAANIDRLIVVASLADPPFRPGLVDRFLVAADMEGIPPTLVLNKVDLATAGDRTAADPYREFGYEVIETSCPTGEGIDALGERMHAGISLLVGHSGVGKSSLLNEVSPGLSLQVGAVAGHHGRGRHTTTKVSLLPLTGGGWVVDSPGIREFALAGVGPSELARLYPGFGELPNACKFSDCRHRNEPKCAVLAAVEAGTLARERYEAYSRVLAELG